jgi:hypothetical protein
MERKEGGERAPITNMGITIRNNILHNAACGSRHKHILGTVNTNKPVRNDTNILGRKKGFLYTCNRKKKRYTSILTLR